MSNLASFSVINQSVEKIYKEEKPNNKGIAFIYLCLRTLFKLTDDEIEETITDGPMDGEVDAIYISDRVIHIMTFKYTDDFDLSKKNFPGSELDQFILTIDALISGNLNKRTVNHAVWDKYEEIKSLSNVGKIEFKIYVVSNKLHPVESCKIKLSDAIEKYKIVALPIYFDQEDLVAKVLENKTEKVDGHVNFIDKQHFEKSDGNIKTVVGAIAALDLVNLVKCKSDVINENIFNENIRVYKPSHRVNKAIIESAKSEDNFQFFYLNNGVTILCENVDYAPNTRNPRVDLTNLQIINGGQTTHSIFEVYKENKELLTTVEILLRICESKKDNPLSEKISETSNNQIPVGNRDLHANDMIQRKLEAEFDTLGYYYERKPNQHSDKPKHKVLNNELLGQLFMAYHLDMPSEAKNSKAKVFSDMYDQIYDEMIISANELIRLNKLYLPLLEQKKEIQKKKRKKQKVEEKEAFVSRAIFHIINGVKILTDNALLKIEKEEISQAKKKTKKENVIEKKGPFFIKQSIRYIYEVVEKQMKLRRDLYTHDKFFKEIPTNSLIKNHILEKLNGK